MNAEVVTVCSREPRQNEPYYRLDLYLASLLRFGEVPTILGMNEWWGGLMTKPFLLRNWLREGKNKSDRLIVCDAYDIIFAGHPHGVGDRCRDIWGDAIVFNCEKACWPRTDLTDQFPESKTPWRFLNSGFMCGPADKILQLLEAMDIESIGFDPHGGPYPNDQAEFQALFVKQPVKMALDSNCVVAQSFSGCEIEEFEIVESRDGLCVRNKATDTLPWVYHFNGGSKNNILPVVAQVMGL